MQGVNQKSIPSNVFLKLLHYSIGLVGIHSYALNNGRNENAFTRSDVLSVVCVAKWTNLDLYYCNNSHHVMSAIRMNCITVVRAASAALAACEQYCGDLSCALL